MSGDLSGRGKMRLPMFSTWVARSPRTSSGRRRICCLCLRTVPFCRFSLIEHFEFSKSFENLKIVADRLPPPPPLFVNGIRQLCCLFPPPPQCLHW